MLQYKDLATLSIYPEKFSVKNRKSEEKVDTEINSEIKTKDRAI